MKTRKDAFNALAALLMNVDSADHKFLRLALENDTFRFGLNNIFSNYDQEDLKKMKEKFDSKKNNFTKKKKRKISSGDYKSNRTDFQQEYLFFFETLQDNRNHRKDLDETDVKFAKIVPQLLTLHGFACEQSVFDFLV